MSFSSRSPNANAGVETVPATDVAQGHRRSRCRAPRPGAPGENRPSRGEMIFFAAMLSVLMRSVPAVRPVAATRLGDRSIHLQNHWCDGARGGRDPAAGRCHAACCSIEQPHAEPGFELADGLTKGPMGIARGDRRRRAKLALSSYGRQRPSTRQTPPRALCINCQIA